MRVQIRGRGRGAIAFAEIDDADAAGVLGPGWFLCTDGYARRKATKAERGAGSPKIISMHRQIAGIHLTPGVPGIGEVDHINRDRLDNRRANLRVVSRSINNMNRTGFGSSSRVGVNWFKPARLWRAYITLRGKQTSLGYFKSEAEAVAAREAAEGAMFHSAGGAVDA